MTIRASYWSLRRLIELITLRRRSRLELEAEIIALRHQLDVLSRQVPRPRLMTPTARSSPRCRG